MANDNELVKQLRYLGDHGSYEPDMHHVAADRIEALEAKLAKAVEALREIADAFGCECGDAARDTLAEIEGEKT